MLIRAKAKFFVLFISRCYVYRGGLERTERNLRMNVLYLTDDNEGFNGSNFQSCSFV